MKGIACAILALLLSADIANAESIGLSAAIHRALARNRSLTALANRLRESDQKIEQARASYWPQFKLGGSYTFLSRLSEIKLNLPLPISMSSIKTGTHNVLDANVSGTYLLHDWGRRAKVVAQAKIGRKLTEINLAGASEEVIYQLIRAYASATLQTENVNLLQKYLEISKKHLDDARTKFANGLVSEFDVLKSELQSKVYEEQLAMARVDQQEAVLSLTEICGGDTLILLEPADSLSHLTIDWPSAVSFDELLAQKPEMRALQTQQTLSQLSAAAERLRPTITAVSSAGWKNSYLPELDKLQLNYVGGLSLTFPIFDGGYSKHRQQEEQEKQKSYQLDIDRILSESRRRMEILYQEMRKIDAKRRITQDKLALARKALEIASVSYGAGLITNSDYLDAEFEIQSIETQSLQDRYSMIMNQLELKKELSYFPEIEH
jgi:outer membrane protein TolC